MAEADGTACVEEIENCECGPDNYTIGYSGKWECPQCKVGYTWNGRNCVACSDHIPNCS